MKEPRLCGVEYYRGRIAEVDAELKFWEASKGELAQTVLANLVSHKKDLEKEMAVAFREGWR